MAAGDPGEAVAPAMWVHMDYNLVKLADTREKMVYIQVMTDYIREKLVYNQVMMGYTPVMDDIEEKMGRN